MNYEGKQFSINLDGKAIWKTGPMDNVLIWLLNKHGVSYRALGLLLDINMQMARRKGKKGARFIKQLHEIDLNRGAV